MLRIKKRLGAIFKQYKYLEFLTWQLSTVLVKNLKPLASVSCEDDLSLSLLSQMFTEPHYQELSDTIEKGIRQLVKFHSGKALFDVSYRTVLLRGLRQIWERLH